MTALARQNMSTLQQLSPTLSAKTVTCSFIPVLCTAAFMVTLSHLVIVVMLYGVLMICLLVLFYVQNCIFQV